MNVKDLIELLQKEDPSALVVISSDEEGNNFNELLDISTNYKFKEKYGGSIGHAKLTPELEDQGYTDEDVMEDGVPAIIFWP